MIQLLFTPRPRKSFVFIICWMLITGNLVAQVKDELWPLPANAVQLEGYLNTYMTRSLVNWNKGVVPYASFAGFFRNGRPQFALGEMWGKSVRSASMFYRYKSDEELKHILEKTVKDLMSTQRPDGSISCVEPAFQPDESDLWERKYVLLGLLSYYNYVARDNAVLKSIEKQADNIMTLIGPAPKKNIIDVGWSAKNIGFEETHIESSSLLEPFMQLYQLTGKKSYLDFAKYIIQSGGSKHHNIFEAAFNNTEPYKMCGHYPKAYEMLSVFEGLADYYRTAGDPRHRQMLLNLYKNVREKEITIIGNGGGDLPHHPAVQGEAWNNTASEQTNPKMDRMMETCVGVTWMKYSSHILRLFADPLAVDDIEKYIYNGLIGSMKPNGQGFSYVNRLNGLKTINTGWGTDIGNLRVTCCNLNGPMGLAYIPYIAVMNSGLGPVINLFNAGKVQMQTPKGQRLSITMKTDYPVSGKVSIKISTPQKEKFALRIRIPGWSQSNTVTVNKQKVTVEAGTYAKIERNWNDDEIELNLDMRCRILDAPRGSNRDGDFFKALVRGPVVLSRDENIDSLFNRPVSVLSNNGYVPLTIEKPSLPGTLMQFRVPVKGGFISVVNYASVNSWDGKKIATWLPMQLN
ncbi:glycoside hydrolase family 127 protein [Niabella yanshanensis]|uniref:Glycoside hydrolase family 127 protein n=1 Tax=Niabella yanshanensis TaxID=577386 RepID=A0ABZ0W8X4_9BACT|nr:beta-L-arabinofuranosidase domain-containing protein [Niabella yanshanensis]WQD38595.1 glycoside hydrolase family 127 protein [Niabella yanshanensis]